MRAALVGCGYIAKSHLRVLKSLRGVEVVGLCDRELERATELARSHRVDGAFQQLDEMIQQTSPDVVHVLTPPNTHRDIAVHVMDAGCHVLVEKPMAVTTAEGEEMASVAERTGSSLAVCHNFRYVPAFLKAMFLLEKGKLGQVRSVEVFWKTSYSPKQRGRASQWIDALPGGVISPLEPSEIGVILVRKGEITWASERGAELLGRDGDLIGESFRSLFGAVANGPLMLGYSYAL